MKTPKPKPIVINISDLYYNRLLDMLMNLSQKKLNEHCRDYGIPIQKYKDDAAEKLASCLFEKPTLTSTIQL